MTRIKELQGHEVGMLVGTADITNILILNVGNTVKALRTFAKKTLDLWSVGRARDSGLI